MKEEEGKGMCPCRTMAWPPFPGMSLYFHPSPCVSTVNEGHQDEAKRYWREYTVVASLEKISKCNGAFSSLGEIEEAKGGGHPMLRAYRASFGR